MLKPGFTILATRCGSCGCGCPTIMESEDGETVVVIGVTGDPAASAKAVTEYVGDGEAAVVIPKSLLLEAVKTLK